MYVCIHGKLEMSARIPTKPEVYQIIRKTRNPLQNSNANKTSVTIYIKKHIYHGEHETIDVLKNLYETRDFEQN